MQKSSSWKIKQGYCGMIKWIEHGAFLLLSYIQSRLPICTVMLVKGRRNSGKGQPVTLGLPSI